MRIQTLSVGLVYQREKVREIELKYSQLNHLSQWRREKNTNKVSRNERQQRKPFMLFQCRKR